jgi:CRP/FNR family transcriptional regulator
MDIIEHVSSIPLFEELPVGQIEELTMIMEDQVFNRGRIVFSEGDKAIGFYVVISGRVKIFKLSPDGKEQILHMFGPGEPFGEVPVFTGQVFPANAEAMEKSRVFFFPRDLFVDLIKKNPSIAMNMLAILSKRLHKFTNLIDDLSLKEVPGRLAAYLVYMSGEKKGSKNLELNITKTQLASLLGTIPETLSRILGKMSKQGLIELHGRQIELLDREGLEHLAEFGGRL